jgi:hypothetical protein
MKKTILLLILMTFAFGLKAQSIPITGNGYHYYGPNTNWGGYLIVGGNGRETTNASVVATNGNLHLDSKDGFATYINRYSNGNTYINSYGGVVGIGTENSRAYLDMAKDISNNQLGTVFGRLPEGDGEGLGTYLGVKGYGTQGADIYNVKSFSIVHDFYGQTNSSINFYRGGSILGGFITFSTSDNTEKMRIGTNGYVGIGTTSPDEKLTVKGKIHAQEVKVDLLGALVPDYVFANDYKLKSLQEVEAYIKQNNHLPEIPSAQEIERNGLMLAEMNMSLLKKMEEMTLYMIDQNKKINAQSKEIIALKNVFERLSKIEEKLETKQ